MYFPRLFLLLIASFIFFFSVYWDTRFFSAALLFRSFSTVALFFISKFSVLAMRVPVYVSVPFVGLRTTRLVNCFMQCTSFIVDGSPLLAPFHLSRSSTA